MAPTTLLHLPPEVLTDIVSRLRESLLPGLDWRDWLCQRRQTSMSSNLSAVAATCRTLRAVATPMLYHSPVPRSDKNLVRTLAEHQDLAALVRVLDTSSWHTLPLVANSLEALKYMPAIPPTATGSNVFFPRLRFMSIGPSAYDQFNRSTHNLQWCAEFLSQSPNLELLWILQCGTIPMGLKLPKLRSLRLLDCSLSLSSLRNITMACPNLDELSWVDMDWETRDSGFGFSIHDLISLLRPLKRTLKHLCLDFPDETDDTDVSLVEFKALETLVIYPSCLVLQVERTDPTAAECDRLIQLLPKNLKNLALPAGCAWETLILPKSLAQAVSTGVLPNLKTVAIPTPWAVDRVPVTRGPNTGREREVEESLKLAWKQAFADLAEVGVQCFSCYYTDVWKDLGASMYDFNPGSGSRGITLNPKTWNRLQRHGSMPWFE